jgi:hypothetical protein
MLPRMACLLSLAEVDAERVDMHTIVGTNPRSQWFGPRAVDNRLRSAKPSAPVLRERLQSAAVPWPRSGFLRARQISWRVIGQPAAPASARRSAASPVTTGAAITRARTTTDASTTSLVPA